MKRLIRALAIKAALIATATTPALSQNRLYVDLSATTNGGGGSWATAHQHIQQALQNIAASPGQFDEVWVAIGTYRPTATTSGGDPRTRTFLLQDGIAFYGGFAGTESSLEQRIPGARTTLSGDLLGNDGPAGTGTGENAYHVVRAQGAGVVRLDGFLITAGNANHPTTTSEQAGGGVYSATTPVMVTDCDFVANTATGRGGGLYVNTQVGDITIKKCTFSNNLGKEGGGLWAFPSNFHNLLIADCRFEGNAAMGLGGGGAYLPSGGMDPNGPRKRVVRCDFIGNEAAGRGGAISGHGAITCVSSRFISNSADRVNDDLPGSGGAINWSAHGGGLCSLQQNLFVNNTAEGNGGAVNVAFEYSTSITSCAFVGNSAARGGALSAGYGSNPEVSNSIFHLNSASISGADIEYMLYPPTVHHSLIGAAWAGAGIGNISSDPRFVDAAGPDGVLGTEDDDLRLRPNSPCIDAGHNFLLPRDFADLDGDGNTYEKIPVDIAGFTRQVDDPGVTDTGVGVAPIVDIGPYEADPAAVVAFCFGDGTGTPCPCGNVGGPGRGCANGSSSIGAVLGAVGVNSSSENTLTLVVAGSTPGQPGVFFHGTNEVAMGQGAAFGDGLRCVGGSVARILVVHARPSGEVATPPGALGIGVQPGNVRHYQWWYRDPGGACGQGFNLSNGLTTTWAP